MQRNRRRQPHLDFTAFSRPPMAGMLAVFAQYKRDILRDRVKAGIAGARKNEKPHDWTAFFPGKPNVCAPRPFEHRKFFFDLPPGFQ